MNRAGLGPVPAAAVALARSWRSPSSLVLIAANLVPLYGVFALGWEVFPLAWNYVLAGEYRHASLQALMHKPYARVVVLHVTILGGGLAAMALGSPLWALLVLLGLKIALDLRAHLEEHRPPARAAA